jgi:hypothetical protein
VKKEPGSFTRIKRSTMCPRLLLQRRRGVSPMTLPAGAPTRPRRPEGVPRLEGGRARVLL